MIPNLDHEHVWHEFRRDYPQTANNATTDDEARYLITIDGAPFARFYQYLSAKQLMDWALENHDDHDWRIIE